MNDTASPALEALVMPAGAQAVAIALFSILALALIVWSLLAWRRGDSQPAFYVASGFATVCLEPFAATMMHAFHPAQGQITLFRAFGLAIPLHVLPIYVLYFGFTGYVLRWYLQRHPSRRAFWSAWTLLCLIATANEYAAVSAGLWVFHGAQPWVVGGILPLWPFPLSITVTLGFTVAMEAWLSLHSCWRRLLVVLVAPFAVISLYGGMSWPIAAALFNEASPAVTNIAAAATVALALFASDVLRSALIAIERTRLRMAPDATHRAAATP